MPRGKFFVIDGTDGSGKKTQTERLIRRMAGEGFPVESISFPRYGQPSAKKVEDYLAGKYGPADALDARTASAFYAEDRLAAKPDILRWLDAGTHVVADRFVASNMGHQGGKFRDSQERRAFFKWNDDLEFGTNALPRPDMNVILHVPAAVSAALVDKRGNAKDGHEADPGHLERAEATYLEMARTFPGFVLVECVENGRLLSVDEIHEKVWAVVRPMLSVTSQSLKLEA